MPGEQSPYRRRAAPWGIHRQRPTRDTIRAEILITKNSGSGPNRYLYHVPIGYVSQPKQDKRNQYFVSAEVSRGSLGIGTIFLPCEVLREYFYRLPVRPTESIIPPCMRSFISRPAPRPPNFASLSNCVIWS
jgi:hypothetical protein